MTRTEYANGFARQTNIANIPFKLCVAGLLLAFVATAGPGQASPQTVLAGRVVDENAVPVADAKVVLRAADGRTRSVFSDAVGRFEMVPVTPGNYTISIIKPGFFRLDGEFVDLKSGDNEYVFTLNHETELRESVEVRSTSKTIDPAQTSNEETLGAREIRDIPVPSTHDLKQSLPTLPVVVRDNSGALHVAGSRIGETQYLLDGFEVGNPVTRGLDARVSVDAVRATEVLSGRYGAQYANAGAGVLALETTPGDDRLRFGATNFIPGLNLKRGVHFGNWYPRFQVSGPLRKGRAWFSEAASLQHTFHIVTEQPRGADSTTQWAGDNLLRLQYNRTPQHILYASFLYNQSNAAHLGLGPFSPLSTTTDANERYWLISVRDQIWLHGALVELGVAGDGGHTRSIPQGPDPYVVTPSATAGNFFEALQKRTRRLQFISNVLVPSLRWAGTHDVSAGVTVFGITYRQQVARSSVETLRADGTLLRRTTFSGSGQFDLSNTQAGFYLQDAWQPVSVLRVQFGIRGDWDRILQRTLVAPRFSASLLPFGTDRARLAASWGEYAQPADLAAFGVTRGQQQIDTFFDPTGTTSVLGPLVSGFVVPASGLQHPRFYTTTLGWVQRITRTTFVGANLTNRDGRHGFAFENEQPGQAGGSFLLQTNRRDHYRAAEVWVQHLFGERAQLAINYTRSRARTNQALDYALGSLVFAPQEPAPVAWDAPNRLLAHGWTPLPFWHLFLSGFFEYRSGFPFSVVNQEQQLVGPPNRLRFPDYLSLNIGLEKRFRFRGHEWAARLAFVNVTGHDNPQAVVNNVDAPNFLAFAGGQGRAVSARLRLVGKK